MAGKNWEICSRCGPSIHQRLCGGLVVGGSQRIGNIQQRRNAGERVKPMKISEIFRENQPGPEYRSTAIDPDLIKQRRAKAASKYQLKPLKEDEVPIPDLLDCSFPYKELGLPPPWEDPWKYANGLPQPTDPLPRTFASKDPVEWEYVERLLPGDVLPDIPKHDQYPTPSGWVPPKDLPSDLPFYVRRVMGGRTFPIYLEERRDNLDHKTIEYNYVELVTLKLIDGDIQKCEKAVRAYCEERLGVPIGTHIHEVRRAIIMKGPPRSMIEEFCFDCGF